MIRRANRADRPALEAVYARCFPGESDFQRWFFDTVWRPEHTLLYQDEAGGVLSNLQDMPVTFAADRKLWPAHYIYAAGTVPEARGRGLMAGLLEAAWAEGRAAGQHFSLLITQNDSLFDFYWPFGYTTLAKAARTEVSPAPLDGAYILRPAQLQDIPAMLAFYRWETAGCAALVRDGTHMSHMLALYGENALVLDGPQGMCQAYAFLEMDDGRPFVKEAMGPQKLTLCQAICNRLGLSGVFQSVAEPARGLPMGCIKGLTAEAEGLLQVLAHPPYLNMMYN